MPKLIFCLACIFCCSCNFRLTDCNTTEEWKINEYRIVKSNCRDVAGPGYSPITVFIGKKSSGSRGFQKDNCTIHFQVSTTLFCIFDVCNKQVTEIRPEKKQLDPGSIDSIKIFSKPLQQTKWLTEKQARKFIQDLNKSSAFDYRDKPVDSVFHPSYQYALTVFTKTGSIEFRSISNLVNDLTHWTYLISSRNNAEYFDRLWNNADVYSH